MDQILGLYTSPNSLQLPEGATLKADNVYLDTDGYFKPFKRIEKAFTDSQMVGYNGVFSTLWQGVSGYNFKFFSKDSYLIFFKTLNNEIQGKYKFNESLNGPLVTVSVPIILNDGAYLFPYDGQIIDISNYSINQYYPSFQFANLLCLGLVSEKKGANPILGIGAAITIVDLSCPPPQIYAATYTLPPSVVYDGDPANATPDRWYANAYRFTTSIDVNGFLIESKPTGSLYVRGSNSASAPGIWIQDMFLRLQDFNGPYLGSKFKLNIYRTPLELADNATTDLVPRESEDFRLVASISSDNPLAERVYEFDDQAVMPPGSAELYTNPTQEGIIKQNEQPPFHHTSSVYKNITFYGNVNVRASIILNVKQGDTGTYTGYWFIRGRNGVTAPIAYDIDLSDPSNSSNFTLGLVYSLDGLLNSFSSPYYATHLNTSGTGVALFIQSKEYLESLNFFDYSGALQTGTYGWDGVNTITVITGAPHGLSTGNIINLYLESGLLDGLETGNQSITVVNTTTFTMPASFTAGLTSGTATIMNITAGGTGSGIFTNLESGSLQSEDTIYTNRIYYSKFQQPFSTTLDQYFTVGSNAPILFLANLREYLLILKQDGVYILRGDDPDTFVVDPLYPQLVLMDSQSIQVVDDYVIGLFTIGVVKLNENGYEIISQPIRDDIQRMINNVAEDGSAINKPPIVFYYQSKRLILIGREQVYVEPESATTPNGAMFADYLAHISYCYHLDSKQWSRNTQINLDGAVEIGGEIYFPARGGTRVNPSVTPVTGPPPISVTFNWDIYRTSIDNSTDGYTRDFRVRFVKQLQNKEAGGGHYRFLKIFFREMNLTSLTVRYYPNYEFSDNSQYFDAVYDDIVTFEASGGSAYSRSMAYLWIPVEVARGNWLSFEIFNTVSSEVDIEQYNGILIEGVELVMTPEKSATV